MQQNMEGNTQAKKGNGSRIRLQMTAALAHVLTLVLLLLIMFFAKGQEPVLWLTLLGLNILLYICIIILTLAVWER
jgi:succinate dehydrogenase hydrophobic anchor subunit